MEWWKSLYEKRFNDLSIWSVADEETVKEQIQYFLLATKITAPKKILDLGAGVGLHVAYFQSLGFDALGLEYSKLLIQKGLSLNPNIKLIASDMRNYHPKNEFDVITYFDTSFGIFSDSSNLKLLKSNYNALRKGGILMIDYMNPAYWKNITENISINDYKEKGGKLIRRYTYNEKTNKLRDYSTYIDPKGKITKYPTQRLSIYKAKELEQILKNIGFSLIHSYGSKGLFYPSSLMEIKKDSAFIQMIAKKS